MKNKLGIVACSLFLAAGALCVAAVLPMPELAFAATNESCMCGDIVFGDDVLTSANDYTNNPSQQTQTNLYKDSTILTDNDFSFDSWSNASYKAKGQQKNYALMLGGSNKGHSSGSFVINLYGYTCDKVIIYAAGFIGDDAAELNLDVSSQSYTLKTTSSYNFNNGYTFNFNKTNRIKIQNNKRKSSVQRVLISKIVFKLYKSNN